jgi:hypothetical protein
MPHGQTSLWPDEVAVPQDDAPVAILREQADALAVVTAGEVRAEVSSMNAGDRSSYRHKPILRPARHVSGEFYGYPVVSVMHGLTPCPVSVSSDFSKETKAKNADELRKALAAVFRVREVVEAVRTLASLAG